MAESSHPGTQRDREPATRLARALASPAGVLVILPALVIAAGVSVLLLGRGATRETAETMARHQLIAQATAVEHDVAFSLDQAKPVLATMRTLADVAMPIPDALTRLRDAVLGRAGVYNATIAFPVGATWGAYYDDRGELRVLESSAGPSGIRVNYDVKNGQLVELARRPNTYDPRTRPYYKVAVEEGKPTWLPPRVFSASGKTGLTVTEPVYGADNKLEAVISIDYDVAELSAFLRNAPLEGAHTVMFTADGTILANSSKIVPRVAEEKRLLHYTDFDDPALRALFAGDTLAAARGAAGTEPHFLRLATTDGDYLVSIAMVGGQRAGTPVSSDWYLATLVPESSLLGPMHRLDRTSIIASIVALAIALGVALLFSWNVVRMRRAVGAARAEARSAEARAKQLGSYQLVERLGLGGMGEVWRAEHQLLARRAAIKLVRSDLDAEHTALVQERFRREAQTLASMRSRHTIELYDYGVTGDGTFFYVMELLDGFDLAQLVKTWGPLPAARVISIIAQACSSLAEAHEAGLLHRDIKPANLVLCRAADEVDIVKVLDFGIVHRVGELAPPVASRPAPRTRLEMATRAGADAPTAVGLAPHSRPPRMPGASSAGDRLTVDGSVIGTPGYIAPEQAQAAALDPRGDIYSLGCVAWYLLTGKEVFRGDTVDDILRAHVETPVPPLRPEVEGWLPAELEAVIVRCLGKHPADRPDARELAVALRELEIPAEHAWTPAMAVAWWAEPRTLDAKPAAVPATAGALLVVADEEPPARSEAATLVARPSNPNL